MIKGCESLLSKHLNHDFMSGAPSNEVKDELRKQRRMRSRRFYECEGAELLRRQRRVHGGGTVTQAANKCKERNCSAGQAANPDTNMEVIYDKGKYKENPNWK